MRFVKPLLVLGAVTCAAMVAVGVVDRPRPAEGAAPATPRRATDEEPSVHVTHELVTAPLVSESVLEPGRRPVARVRSAQPRRPPPRGALARWFFGDGAYRPSPFPRPAQRQRSTMR